MSVDLHIMNVPGEYGLRHENGRSSDAERVVPLSLIGTSSMTEISPVWEALTASVLHACDIWRRVVDFGGSADDAREYAAHICSAIRLATLGQPFRLGELAPLHPTPRFVELVRRSFLDRARQLRPESASAVLQVLTGLDAIQQRMESGSDRIAVGHLTVDDALELVLEVAHDMRSPLTSILLLVDTLRRGGSGGVTPVQERQLGIIYSAAFALGALASDAIELVRGGDRLIDLQPIALSVSEILDSVHDIVQPIAEQKGLALRIDRPQCDVRMGYVVALHRVMLNLTTNALKFTSTGEVEIGGRTIDEERIEFFVRDTGGGIPSHVLEHLFEAIRPRPDEHGHTFSSAGLGLTISRSLVRRMGGELEVESRTGDGTRFHFVLRMPSVRQG